MKWWILAAVALGLVVRLGVLAGPMGELDADEAVVGLMARHIAFDGELPIFYYGQAYLGSLEAFTAAPLFRVFSSSGVLLKLVPLAYSLGFLVLSALVARRVFGDGPAVLTAFYLALPPAMWALWSTKARGGYAEVLFLGEGLLLLSLWLGSKRRVAWGALAWGLIAGLALWTHLLAVVYILPALRVPGAATPHVVGDRRARGGRRVRGWRGPVTGGQPELWLRDAGRAGRSDGRESGARGRAVALFANWRADAHRRRSTRATADAGAGHGLGCADGGGVADRWRGGAGAAGRVVAARCLGARAGFARAARTAQRRGTAGAGGAHGAGDARVHLLRLLHG